MVSIFIAISNSIIDSGFSSALIRKVKVKPIEYNTVFYFNLLISLLLYICLFFISPSFLKYLLPSIIYLNVSDPLNSFIWVSINLDNTNPFFAPSDIIILILSISVIILILSFKIWYAREELNLQPSRYERPALTVELRVQARIGYRKIIYFLVLRYMARRGFPPPLWGRVPEPRGEGGRGGKWSRVLSPSPAPAVQGHPLPQGERESVGTFCS